MGRWDKPRLGAPRLAQSRFGRGITIHGQGGGAAAEASSYPAENIVIGIAPTSGGSNAPSSTYIIGGRPVWRDGTLTQFRCQSNATATLKLKLFRRNGRTYTFVSEQSLSVVSGTNTFSVVGGTLTGVPVLAGDVFAVYSATNNFIQFKSVSPSKTEYYAVAGDITTTTDVAVATAPSAGTQLQIEFTVSVSEAVAYEAIGNSIYIGEPSPTTGTGNAVTTETYFEDHEFVTPMRLETLQVFAGAVGALMVLVLTPTASGFTTRAFTVSIASGTNNLVAGTDFPIDVVIPTGGFLGYWNLMGTSVRVDSNTVRSQLSLDATLAGGVYPVSPATAFVASGSTVALQVKAGLKKTQALSLSATRLDYTFSAVIHPRFNATNWSIVAGKAQNGATGLGNAIIWRRGGLYDATVSAYVAFSGLIDVFAIFRKPPSSLNVFGTVATIDLATNTIAIRNTWDGSTSLPAVNTSKVSTVIFQTGREYKIDLVRIGGLIQLVVTDTVDASTDTLSFSCFNGLGTLSSAPGRCSGNPGFAALTGTVDVSRLVFSVPSAQPKVMVFGDSISDGQGATSDGTHYAALVRAGVSGSALIAGSSGSTSSYPLNEMEKQLRQFYPQHAVLMIGTNDTVVATWKANIDKIVEYVTMTGATLWLMAVLPEAADANPEVEFNPYLRTNYASQVVSSDYALTTGRTGLGANLIAGLKFDTLHPNDAGHAAIYAEIQSAAPGIFA